MDWLGVWTRRGAVAIVAVTSLAAAGTAVAAQRTTLVRTAPMIATSNPMDPFGRLSNDTVTSTNWSGYAVEAGSKFTDVKGSWVEPTVTCNTIGARYAAFWAGIDGYASSSVEQLGTDSDCAGYGRPSYYAWYEMYPAGSVDLSTSLYPVSPGDTLSAEVSVTGVSYTLSLHSSRGWTFTTTKTAAGLDDSSAELIAESPEICGLFFCHFALLPNFGTVPFSNVEAATGGADGGFDTFTTDSGPLDIVGQNAFGVDRMVPSSLTPGPSGDAFSITWEHA